MTGPNTYWWAESMTRALALGRLVNPLEPTEKRPARAWSM
jgi:hypothetical protein